MLAGGQERQAQLGQLAGRALETRDPLLSVVVEQVHGQRAGGVHRVERLAAMDVRLGDEGLVVDPGDERAVLTDGSVDQHGWLLPVGGPVLGRALGRAVGADLGRERSRRFVADVGDELLEAVRDPLVVLAHSRQGAQEQLLVMHDGLAADDVDSGLNGSGVDGGHERDSGHGLPFTCISKVHSGTSDK